MNRASPIKMDDYALIEVIKITDLGFTLKTIEIYSGVPTNFMDCVNVVCPPKGTCRAMTMNFRAIVGRRLANITLEAKVSVLIHDFSRKKKSKSVSPSSSPFFSLLS